MQTVPRAVSVKFAEDGEAVIVEEAGKKKMKKRRVELQKTS